MGCVTPKSKIISLTVGKIIVMNSQDVKGNLFDGEKEEDDVGLKNKTPKQNPEGNNVKSPPVSENIFN